MPFRMVRWLWFGRPVRGLSGGSNGSKRRHCASVKSLRLTRATWALRAGLVPLCRHAVDSERWSNSAAVDLIEKMVGRDNLELLHIYTGQRENFFDFIFRHTLGRPRDLMMVGGKISELDPSSRTSERLRQ